MELKITAYEMPKAIDFNFEELKAEIKEKADLYKNMVYTDETIKEAKTDKAKLNKFITALEDKRKEVKKQCLQPYEEFEKQVKELVAIVNEPVKLIDAQVKDFEDRQKAEKEVKIQAIWEKEVQEANAEISLDKIFNDRWLNVTFTLKKVQEEIKARIEQFNADLAALDKLPEFSFEAVEVYKQTLDMNRAIAEGQRLADIQKRKQEAEAAKLKAEEEKTKVQEIAEQAEVNGVASCTGVIEAAEELTKQLPAKQWVKFEALLSVEEARELRAFLNQKGIDFRMI